MADCTKRRINYIVFLLRKVIIIINITPHNNV